MRKQRIGDLPSEAARRWGDRLALIFEGRRWTHAEVSREVDRVAKGLIALGVRPQDKVALWLVNRPEFIFAFFAIAKVGAVLVPLNTRYRTSDFAIAMKKADCTTLILASRSGPIDYAAMLRESAPDLAGSQGTVSTAAFPDLRHIVLIDEGEVAGARSWEDVLDLAERVDDVSLATRAVEVDPDAVAMIIYTSGTTSTPKGVMHSHICVRAVQERSLPFGATCTDVVLNFLPMFHLFGISILLQSVLTGMAQILMGKFDAAESVRQIAREKVTMVHGFSTHWKEMRDEQRRNPVDISTLKIGLLGSGSPDVIPTAYEAQEFCPTVSGFGMSECWSWCALCFPTSTLEQRCESSGTAMPDTEFRIVDPETGHNAEVGQVGELYIRTYSMMLGYYKEPEATAAVFDGEWLRTGDMGLIRPDGFIRFLGRYKDMLKVGGENVAPAEIEQFLREAAPQITHVAVVGVPDDRLDEVPVAFVVTGEGSTLTSEQLAELCTGKLASFKTPRAYHFLGAMPMTTTGKIIKSDLAAMARDLQQQVRNVA